jgi:transposase
MAILIQQKELSKFNSFELEEFEKQRLIDLSKNLLFTISCLYDQINENSTNSAKPSSSDLPWKKNNTAKNDASYKEASSQNKSDNDLSSQKKSAHHNRADKRKPREKGFGRREMLHITDHKHLKPIECFTCAKLFCENDYKRYHAFKQIDLRKRDEGIKYHEVIHTKYHLYDGICSSCQEVSRAKLTPIKTDISHITISAMRLIGPTLAAVMILMHKENGTSLKKIKTTIREMYGVNLSKGAICTAVNEGGVCCEMQVELYRQEAQSAEVAHMDETSWRDCGNLTWLWVFATSCTVVFMMGGRTKKMALEFLNGSFKGFLMSDGYQAYRHYKKRLRCWAHLHLKAKGLSESSIEDIRMFGCQLLALLDACMKGIYQARDAFKNESIKEEFSEELAKIKTLCEQYKGTYHAKTKALAREFLNDWDAIFRILDYPFYPLTNNEAERALRHWVILRKVILGTQSEIGRRATCAIASVIATAKKRGENVLQSIKNAIHVGKKHASNITDQPLRLSG